MNRKAALRATRTNPPIAVALPLTDIDDPSEGIRK
jgi:hypothetical protein